MHAKLDKMSSLSMPYGSDNDEIGSVTESDALAIAEGLNASHSACVDATTAPLLRTREWALSGLVLFALVLVLLLCGYRSRLLVGLTFLGTVAMYGLLYQCVQRRQRLYRLELVSALREMLADRIKNNLMVLVLVATDRDKLITDDYLGAALEAADAISTIVDNLSLSSLRQWQDHYRKSQTFR